MSVTQHFLGASKSRKIEVSENCVLQKHCIKWPKNSVVWHSLWKGSKIWKLKVSTICNYKIAALSEQKECQLTLFWKRLSKFWVLEVPINCIHGNTSLSKRETWVEWNFFGKGSNLKNRSIRKLCLRKHCIERPVSNAICHFLGNKSKSRKIEVSNKCA